MASAIQTVGGNQIVRLGSPLILGIRLQGTIGHLNPLNPSHIRARPYLRYLADTLRHLRCDVTLLVSTNHAMDSFLLSQFASLEFPLPFRLLHDHDDVHQRTNRNRTVSSRNYTNFFRGVAEEHGATTDRVLFVDAEINYRFTPVQTLVLEAYAPLTRRQQRQDMRRRMKEAKAQRAASAAPIASAASTQPHSSADDRRKTGAGGFGSNTNSRPSGAAADTRHPEERARENKERQRRRDEYQAAVRSSLDEVQKHTRALVAEQHFAGTLAEPVSPMAEDDAFGAAAGGGVEDARGATNWLGRHDGRRRHVTSRNTLGAAEQARDGSFAGTEATFTEEDYQAAASASDLAVNLEDYSLVALADMVTQLATSDMPVRDFLRTEPLVEKLRVPFHGVANYLPIENCDDIEVLDWERIKVEEKAARDGGVPDLEETKEHEDFFK